jgi:hypothetical protein
MSVATKQFIIATTAATGSCLIIIGALLLTGGFCR